MNILHDATRLSWDAATRAHNSHKRDQAGFLRQGGSTLFPEERALLGEIANRSLAHLQCNAGQDSLSLAALGARVTGVDISDEAIAFATTLSRDSGIPARFVRADVLDWFEETTDTFDVVFSSYGAVGWLADIAAWAQGIYKVLRPGGRFVYVEFHPLVWSVDPSFKLAADDYFAHGKTFSEPVNDYVAASGAALCPSGLTEGVKGFENPHVAHSFQWTLADIVSALAQAGMRIETLREYPYLNGLKLWPELVEQEGSRYVLPPGLASFPLMFGLAATR